jgi:hypothetical protein
MRHFCWTATTRCSPGSQQRTWLASSGDKDAHCSEAAVVEAMGFHPSMLHCGYGNGWKHVAMPLCSLRTI